MEHEGQWDVADVQNREDNREYDGHGKEHRFTNHIIQLDHLLLLNSPVFTDVEYRAEEQQSNVNGCMVADQTPILIVPVRIGKTASKCVQVQTLRLGIEAIKCTG